MTDLGDFEGSPVRQAGITIPGLAGGLRDAMKIDPEAFHKGARVFVVSECVVADVGFEAIDKDDVAGDQRRVHKLQVVDATIVDEALVRSSLDDHRLAVERARDAANGQGRLDVAALSAAHADAGHADGLVDGCPECDHEKALTATEGEPLAAPAPAKKAAAKKKAAPRKAPEPGPEWVAAQRARNARKANG